jgi:hypothetical protein
MGDPKGVGRGNASAGFELRDAGADLFSVDQIARAKDQAAKLPAPPKIEPGRRLLPLAIAEDGQALQRRQSLGEGVRHLQVSK